MTPAIRRPCIEDPDLTASPCTWTPEVIEGPSLYEVRELRLSGWSRERVAAWFGVTVAWVLWWEGRCD